MYMFILFTVLFRVSYASFINDEETNISNLQKADIRSSNFNNKYTGRVPDTGQTTCYDNEKEIPCPQPGEDFYGQDGNYLINEPSYTKLDENGNDLPDSAEHWVMVRDNVTGLIWEVKTDDGSIHDRDNVYTWYDSNPETNGGHAGTPGDGTDTEDYIKSLNRNKVGGFSDWRLPTVKEFVYLFDYEEKYAVNTKYFPQYHYNPSQYSHSLFHYWTSETFYYEGDTYNLNTVAAYSIDVVSGYFIHCSKSSRRKVRAVRGNSQLLLNSFIDNSDGTMTDISTGLMWGERIINSKHNWQLCFNFKDSNEYETKGFYVWRIPNYKEIVSIADFSHPKGLLKHYSSVVCKNDIPGLWSSTTFTRVKENVLTVFNDHRRVCEKKTTNTAWCIRTLGGQNKSPEKLYIEYPLQASFLIINEKVKIIWKTRNISGNVRLSISRNAGQDDTLEIIADETENDGFYTWDVTGPASYNCALKITPINDPSKENILGLFTIQESKFNTIWNGNPLESMAIWILPESFNNLELSIGDEIGIFDSNTCVGVGIINNENDAINIITSKNDNETTPNGFQEGNPIQFKIWDYSQQKEIPNIAGDYYNISTLDPINDNTFQAKDDRCVVLKFSTIDQKIALDEGWNIISLNVTPEKLSAEVVFKELIKNDSLIKVIDEEGNRLIYSAISKGWINRIGNISSEEGYMIKMNKNDILQANGIPIDLPLDISIKNGWNIIGYPGTQSKDALTVVDSLIQNNSLEKVIDEKGNRLIYSFFQKQWVNDIGNFIPGHGYHLKAKEIDTLTITKPDSNNRKLRKKSIKKRSTQTSHFKPIWNTPFSSMSLWLFDIKNFDESTGDEIGIFDNDKCVGSAVITDTLSIENNITIILSKYDGDGKINGFIEGNPIIFKIWDKDQNKEITDLEIKYVNIMTGEEYEEPVPFTANMDVAAFIETKNCESPVISPIEDIMIYSNTEQQLSLSDENVELSYTTTFNNQNILITFNNNVMTIKAKNNWTGDCQVTVIESNACGAMTQISFNLKVIPDTNKQKLRIETDHYAKHGMKYKLPIYAHNPEKRKIESLTMQILPANANVITNHNSKATLIGSKLDNKSYKITYNAAEGKIAIFSSDIKNLFNESGIIAFVEFAVIGNCGYSSNINFVGTNSINGIPVTTENGKVSVINNCPVFAKGPDISENEDTKVIKEGWATHISHGEGNESSQKLSFHVTCDDPSIFEKIPEITPSGDLSYTPKKDANGSSSITVKLLDDGGTANAGCNASKAEKFTVTILPVNDCPYFKKGKDIVNSISSAKVTIPNWATKISAGPGNESQQKLTFHVSTNNDELFETLPAITSDGTLTYKAKSDKSGEADIAVFLQDNGPEQGCNKSETETFTISIIKYNLSGTISYYNEKRPVPNVVVRLNNNTNSYTTTSNSHGRYIFTSVSPGSYKIQLSKADDLTGLSGSDATEIAGYVVNISNFNDYQKIAANIFNDGIITAFNAARVAQYPARNCFYDSNECIQWKFIDKNSNHPRDLSIKIDTDKKDIDFTAIRLGDVTGNWRSTIAGKRAKIETNNNNKVIEIFKGSFLSIPVIFNVKEQITGIDIGVDYSNDDIKADKIELSAGLSDKNSDNAYTYFAHATNDGKSSFVVYTTPPSLYTPKQAEVLLKLNIQAIGNVGSISNFSFNKLEVNENPNTDAGFLIDGQVYKSIDIKISQDPGNDEKLGLAEAILALKCNSLSQTCQNDVSLEEVLNILQFMSCFEE